MFTKLLRKYEKNTAVHPQAMALNMGSVASRWPLALSLLEFASALGSPSWAWPVSTSCGTVLKQYLLQNSLPASQAWLGLPWVWLFVFLQSCVFAFPLMELVPSKNTTFQIPWHGLSPL